MEYRMMNRDDFIKRVQEGILLFDGGIGTQLQAKGLKVGEVPEAWNLEHPDWVEAIHRSYVEAGAQVLTTNSFGGSRYKLEKTGLGDKMAEINRRAAAIAKEAAGGNAWVVGSVGPTGEFLQPLGTVPPEEMKEGFKLQIKSLIEGGADLIIVETMSDLEEASLAVQAARVLGDFPVIGSMTFNPVKQGYRTMMGVDIPSSVSRLLDEGADAVGSNCGNGIDDFIIIVAEMRECTDRPILAEANAGLPELVHGKTVYRETPDMMASKLDALLDAGADIVGGCCGTTPDHIRRFVEVIDKRHAG
jgi:5-methyltetrahydrofolate--homocysteine methyltransferase